MKYLINVTTDFAGFDKTFAVEAENDDVEFLAEELAIDNLLNYFSDEELLEISGYDCEKLSEEEYEYLSNSIDYTNFCDYTIEECNNEKEWQSYEQV